MSENLYLPIIVFDSNKFLQFFTYEQIKCQVQIKPVIKNAVVGKANSDKNGKKGS